MSILFLRVAVSAGMRDLQILIAPDDYLRATQAVVAAISKAKE
jgi:prolyl-tRNA editing enzyme YbaK/EbsC (Cys-tRNA(Pro) deacylase)